MTKLLGRISEQAKRSLPVLSLILFPFAIDAVLHTVLSVFSLTPLDYVDVICLPYYLHLYHRSAYGAPDLDAG